MAKRKDLAWRKDVAWVFFRFSRALGRRILVDNSARRWARHEYKRFKAIGCDPSPIFRISPPKPKRRGGK